MTTHNDTAKNLLARLENAICHCENALENNDIGTLQERNKKLESAVVATVEKLGGYIASVNQAILKHENNARVSKDEGGE